MVEPESHQPDFGWARRGSLSGRRDAVWLQEELEESSGKAAHPAQGLSPVPAGRTGAGAALSHSAQTKAHSRKVLLF